MPFKPVISKIRCHNPNKISSKHANRNYLIYIATREGVDISDTDSIDTLLNKIDLNKIEVKEEYLYANSSSETYLKYMACRPKSHGLFGNVDTNDLNKVARDVSHLTEHGKNIYRGVISFSPEDAKNLGYYEVKQWKLLLNEVLPDIAKELGVSNTNFTWVAAYHAEKGHPHVHYELWDNTDRVKSSFIHVSVQHKCREIISNAAFHPEYESMIREVLKDEIQAVYNVRNSSRTNITDITKEIVNSVNINTLPERIKNKELAELSEKILKLSDILPTKGSSDYSYLSEDIKEYVNNISESIIKRKDINIAYQQFLQSVEDGQKLVGKNKFELKKAIEYADKDIHKRISNIVIKQSLKLRRELSLDNNLNISIQKVVDMMSPLDDTLNDIMDDYEDKEGGDTMSPLDNTMNDIMNSSKEQEEGDTVSPLDDILNDIMDASEEQEEGDTVSPPDDILDDIMDASKEQEEGDMVSPLDDGTNNISNDVLFQEEEVILLPEDEINDLKSLVKGLIRGSYVIDWNDDYKLALDYLYNDEKRDFNKAYTLLLAEAKNNNVLALHDMGKIFEKGLGKNKNTYLANKYYAASLHGFKELEKNKPNKYIEYRIGKFYERGSGIDQDYSIAQHWYSMSADMDYKYAQYSLGAMIKNNKIIIDNPLSDKALALELFVSSSKQVNAYSSYELGLMYEKGIGTKIDLERSNYYYKDAFNNFLVMLTQRSDDNLLYRVGKMYQVGLGTEINITKAIECFEEAAKSNNKFAEYTLGKLYVQGVEGELEKDIPKGINYLTRAAEKGNEFAEYTLGKLYVQGIEGELEKDIPKGIDYLIRAAEKGNEFAVYTLGKLNVQGVEGELEKDIPKGLDYLIRAAEKGNEFTEYTLGKLYVQGIEGDLERDIPKGLEYLEKAAGKGNEFAEYTLGKLYVQGVEGELEKDIPKGLKYLEKAVIKGNQFAEYSLGKLYIDGVEGILQPDFKKGFELINKASSKGNEFAQHEIGKLYIKGVKGEFERDTIKGLKILEGLAEKGNSMAQHTLGRLYLFGSEGVKKNKELGLYWLGKAVDQGNTYAQETMDFYEKYKFQSALTAAFTIIKSSMNSVNNELNNQYWRNQIYTRSMSRQAIKEEYIHQRIGDGRTE